MSAIAVFVKIRLNTQALASAKVVGRCSAGVVVADGHALNTGVRTAKKMSLCKSNRYIYRK